MPKLSSTVQKQRLTNAVLKAKQSLECSYNDIKGMPQCVIGQLMASHRLGPEARRKCNNCAISYIFAHPLHAGFEVVVKALKDYDRKLLSELQSVWDGHQELEGIPKFEDRVLIGDDERRMYMLFLIEEHYS
ncbi:hypothetical protein [Myxococcus phage Mx1]|nr:hypothetical protein [Myxococcus phage Mx1]